MKLDGRRESSNVEDRRGMSGGTAAGIGLGGVALIALIVLLQGGSLGDVVKVVCLGKDKMGRISFSMKDVRQD